MRDASWRDASSTHQRGAAPAAVVFPPPSPPALERPAHPSHPQIFSGGGSYVTHTSRSLSPGSFISYGSSLDSTAIRHPLRPSDESPSMDMLLRVSFTTTHCLLLRKIYRGQSRYKCTPKIPPCHVHHHLSNGLTLSAR